MKGWGTVNEIKVKLAQGKTVSEVARELSIDRKTVRKYRDQTMEEIAGEREADQKRRQKLDDYKDWIKSRVKRMAEDGVINAESIYHEVRQLGYAGSARSVRRFVEGLRPALRPTRVYRRFETPPGQQAMVDLAEKRGVRIGDRRRTIYFVAMVLSSSRHKYVEWFDRPVDTEMLLAFHESAFRSFEGMPREIVYDQTKLAVLAEHYGEVEFNQAFYSYVQWRHIEPYICHKSDPETKGKIESAVRYVKRSFLVGRDFNDLGDLYDQWDRWKREIADVKPHETTGRPPREAWEEEKAHLRPLADEGVVIGPAYRVHLVQTDNWIKVLGNAYEIPPGHEGKEVKVRVTEERVEIRDLESRPIYTHWRSLERSQRVYLPAADRPRTTERREELTRQVLEVLPLAQWIRALDRNFPRHYREQCRAVLALARKTDRNILIEAARRLLDHDCVSYGNLKKAVAYLEDQGTLPLVEAERPPGRLPGDLGLEPRSADYYDELLEVKR